MSLIMSALTIRGMQVHNKTGEITVRIDRPEEITASGIIIPKSAKKETDFLGTVVCVPKHNEKEEVKIELGDRVVFRKNAGVPVVVDDSNEDHKIISKKDILYVF